nr:receptor-interacting serine/threonine-protein kinase 4-like isoform X2 [Crassostrea virginica]
MMFLIGSLVGITVYLRHTGKICYNERDQQEETKPLQSMAEYDTGCRDRTVTSHLVHSNGQSLSVHPSPDELESEHFLGDIDLLILLQRHCEDGIFENFIYLFKRKILENGKKILRIIESRDNNGWSLLHYAAKGGSKDILKTLLEHCDESKLYDTDNAGRTVLHIACKNGQYNLCVYILSNDRYCKRLLTVMSHVGWNAAHFTAVSGKIELFDLLYKKGEIDIQSETKNGLNILHIACIHGNTFFCKTLVNMNKELNLPFEKTDPRGWNIAHHAAKVGDIDLFNCFINEEFTSHKTHCRKTVLHICCENGHYELCELILKESPLLGKVLHDVDDEGWNALHYAAKGGNLKVFKMIEDSLKSSNPLETLCTETFYYETVLHICCIHKNVDICSYICNKLKSAPHKLNKVSTNNWTAAHYVAVEIQQDGTEEKLISILEEAGIDLKSLSEQGKTVLTVAFEHRNDNLIKYLLTHHMELVKINTPKLREAVAHSNIYEEMLEEALQKVNSQ